MSDSHSMTLRVCTRCKQSKLLSEFHRHRSQPGGFNRWCKVCVKESRPPEYAAEARVRTAAWIAANKERAKASYWAWARKNPESRLTIGRNRTAIKRGARGKLSAGIRERLWKLQKGKCPCCGQPLGKDPHIDHIIPIALGGTNTDDNVQLLRAKCNLAKHAKHPVDFMRERGFLL